MALSLCLPQPPAAAPFPGQGLSVLYGQQAWEGQGEVGLGTEPEDPLTVPRFRAPSCALLLKPA